MKQTRILMGMPITVEVVDPWATDRLVNTVFTYFEYVDAKFSTYKETSEISALNRGEIMLEEASDDMQQVFALAEETKQATDGYFDIRRNGSIDPSGLVKGWAIYNAAQVLRDNGVQNSCVEAGGDMEVMGLNEHGEKWRVGIRNPFHLSQIVQVLRLTDCGVATSGSYIRGQHVYNPLRPGEPIQDVVSVSVIGPNIYEADRFATAAFAMGREGIRLIEALPGFEGYMIDADGRATLTSGWKRYVSND